ncbi:hypothetical protein ADK64_08770 [Streptomyces sp. MMG1121]|nr:hypothetical protein ADK64_08770 [Streptomyces sp. MMG1121]
MLDEDGVIRYEDDEPEGWQPSFSVNTSHPRLLAPSLQAVGNRDAVPGRPCTAGVRMAATVVPQ